MANPSRSPRRMQAPRGRRSALTVPISPSSARTMRATTRFGCCHCVVVRHAGSPICRSASSGRSGYPTASGLVVLAEVYREASPSMRPASTASSMDEDPVKAHVTEDRTYRFWDVWLTEGKVPHLFRVPVEGGEALDLIPDSKRWWQFPSTDNPMADFDIAPDGSRDRLRRRHLRASPLRAALGDIHGAGEGWRGAMPHPGPHRARQAAPLLPRRRPSRLRDAAQPPVLCRPGETGCHRPLHRR